MDSDEMDTIRECAEKNKIIVSLGFSENDGTSLYLAQCTISSPGEILMKRRKMKPTHMERTIFGPGSGSSLVNVFQTEVGRVGALMCSPGRGTSAVFGPDGRLLSEPLETTEEAIIYADPDINDIFKCKEFADRIGHYSRPDLLCLGVDTVEKKKVHVRDASNLAEGLESKGSPTDSDVD